MGAFLLALGSWGAAPGLPQASTVIFSLLASLAGTSAVAWWGHSLQRDKTRRERDELAAATPVAGIH
jgi:hypothetical protein